MFLCYVGAYTGLLWYQYTKVFSGPHALKPLLIGVSVGLPLGFILHHELPNFLYADIIALGAATWTWQYCLCGRGKIVGTSCRKSVRSPSRFIPCVLRPGSRSSLVTARTSITPRQADRIGGCGTLSGRSGLGFRSTGEAHIEAV
jgi:hypothetical protein